MEWNLLKEKKRHVLYISKKYNGQEYQWFLPLLLHTLECSQVWKIKEMFSLKQIDD
jgi:hypothetical protein